MGSRKELLDFWKSYFSIQGHFKDLDGIEDQVERVIQMMCRSLFLLVMDIKKERDEAVEVAAKQRNWMEDCQNCKKQVSKANLNDARIDEYKVSSSESYDSQITVVPNIKKEFPSQTSPEKEEGNCVLGDGVSDKPVSKGKKKRSPNYRCLSKSSPRTKKKLKKETVDIEEHILVPETVSLDEHDLYVNIEARKALATQTVFVPETLMYGNTDFFESQNFNSQDLVDYEDSNKLDEIRSPHINKNNESETCKTPEKNSASTSDLKTQFSPVLGKKSNTTPIACRRLQNVSSPTPLVSESPCKEPLHEVNDSISTDFKTHEVPASLQINTEDLKSENLICGAASTPKYSPLKFTHNLSPLLSDVSFTSPSLLPSLKNQGNDLLLSPPSPSFKTPNKVKPIAGKKSFKRSLSAVSNNAAKETSRSIRRHQTDIAASKGRLYEVKIEPPVPSKQKKYKQARISEMPLVPKIDVVKLSGGIPKLSFDDELKAAFEASLKTKEKEDLMRKQVMKSDTSPTKTENDIAEKNPVKKSPKKLPLKLKDSPFKDIKNSPKKSPLKRLRQSPHKSSPRKKGRKENDTSMDKGVVSLDELLNQVNDSPVQANAVSPKKIPLKTSEHMQSEEKATSGINSRNAKWGRAHSADEIAKKNVKKKRPLQPYNDSFDVLPAQNSEPDYAYKGDAVRKKVERKQLKGWLCHECKNWYADDNLDEETLKMIMNRCSRHRSKHNPITNTPEGFWNPEWEDKTQSPG